MLFILTCADFAAVGTMLIDAGFEAIETQGVLRIALRAPWILVDLQEHAVDACSHCSARER